MSATEFDELTRRAENAARIWGCAHPDLRHFLTPKHALADLDGYRFTHVEATRRRRVFACTCGAWVWGEVTTG